MNCGADSERGIFTKYWLILLILLSAGTIFRVYFIGYRSFWIDEVFSVYFASSSIKGLFNLLNADNQSPLYFLLLHCWIKLLGGSDVSVRLLSVLWGGAGILGIYYLLGNGLKWSERSALLGAFLVTISPLHFYYSIEARPYAMLFAIAVFYLASLCRIYSAGRNGYYIAFVGLQILLLYTHPTALIYCFTINAIYLLLLLSMKQLNKLSAGKLLIANAVTLLFFLPWIGTYWLQVQATSENFWAPPLTLTDTIKILVRLVIFLSTDLIDLNPRWFTFSARNIFVWTAAAFPVVILMSAGLYYSFKRKVLPELLIVASFFLYPIILFVISILSKPIMITRVLIPASIGFIALILIPKEQHPENYKKAVLHVLLALFVLICLTSDLLIIRVGGVEDWRKAAKAVSEMSKKDELVLFYENHKTFLFNRYNNRPDILTKGITGDYEEKWELKRTYGIEWGKHCTGSYNFPIDSTRTDERLCGLIANRQRLFLILAPLSRNNMQASQKIILEKLRDYKTDEIVTMGNIRIFSLSRT